MPPANEVSSNLAASASEDKADWMFDFALHELRNSLSAIQLGVELIGRREGAALPPSSTVLAHMESAARRAQASTVELEDIYRLVAGQHLSVSPATFSLHALVRDALDGCRDIAPGVLVEHDRLGEGDCVGDPARMAQFLAFALEDLCAAATPALVVVISEVAGDCFRVAVHVDGERGAAPSVDLPGTRSVQQSRARRRVMLKAIAQAHGGQVDFDRGHAPSRSIDGSFSSLAGRPAG